MARASTYTMLSIDRFAEIVAISPLHMNQVYLPEVYEHNPVTCDVPILQYSWQDSGRIGREEIAEAIYNAESIITKHLGFAPMPRYFENDVVMWPRPANPVLYPSGLDIRGYLSTLQASYGYMIRGGKEVRDFITTSPVTYIDKDGDTYKETATAVVHVEDTLPTEEIALYYPGESGDPAWEIREVKRTVSPGTPGMNIVTLEFKRHHAVKPELQEMMWPRGVNGLDDNSFLTEVDIYHKRNDPVEQIQFTWNTGGFCGQCAACLYATQGGCFTTYNKRLSLISMQAADWTAENGFVNTMYAMCRIPDSVVLNYQAGWPNPKTFERAVAYLALTFLTRPLCRCQPVENAMRHWTTDLAQSTTDPTGGMSFSMSRGALDNPLGTTRAAMFVWNLIRQYAIGHAAVNA